MVCHPRASMLESSLRTTLGGDRVVLESLRHALEITGCTVAFLHVGLGQTHLCIARHDADRFDRIRRATMCETVADLTRLESFSDVPRFPYEPPRDLFDPTRVRSYAVAPFPPQHDVHGALVCLDERPRPFLPSQLQDLEALAFTIIGRLIPMESASLGERLRTLRGELEPVTALVRSSPGLSHSWRELTGTIEAAARELDRTKAAQAV